MKNKGVLVDHQIEQLIHEGILNGTSMDRVQPSSVDIELDLNTLMHLDHFTLPKRGETVEMLVRDLRRNGSARDKKDLLLSPKQHYLVRAKTSCSKMPCFTKANPKSSVGRIFLHSRLLCDRSTAMDEIPIWYKGNLWILLSPKFFPTALHEDEPVNQLRFFHGDARLSADDICREMMHYPNMIKIPKSEYDGFGDLIDIIGDTIGEVPISVDLKHACYRVRSSERPLTLNEREAPWQEYYERIDPSEMKHGLILEKGRGYIIGTIEEFQIPPSLACEVFASDRWGECQPDFAGFVDTGFGFFIKIKRVGNTITLEIIAYEDGLCIRHGQRIGTVRFEWTAAQPKKLYQGNYTIQPKGGRLPKYVLQPS